MLKIYNTLSRKKEIFKPRRNKAIKMFVCGPTVYDFSHIGHARTYIAFDMIVKYLKEKGYNVFYLQNITDIDDKIIKRAKKEKIKPGVLAKRFEKEYFRDMKSLRIDSVKKYARATDYIKEIISQVERLIKKGFAYQIEDGIYYDIRKFKNYGKLSKRTVLQAEDAISRIDESKEKKNKGDFCLWKKSKVGEPKWKSSWFFGRPGWHIEDTSITEKHFGPQYDIHGGAKDLIFPHHEAEIAQIEAISGKSPMVKYWLHSGFLTVKGRKMAKSLGNFITIRDFLKNYSFRVLKLFVLKSHYRSPIDYNEKVIKQTKRDLERICEFIDKLEKLKNKRRNVPLSKEKGLDAGRGAKALVLKTKKEFERAMDDDFNTPAALSSIFHLINRGNWLFDRDKLSSQDAKDILKVLREIDKVFGFISRERKKEKVPQSVLKLVKLREKYRKEQKWQKADEVRKEIEKLEYQIEDTTEGPKVKNIKY